MKRTLLVLATIGIATAAHAQSGSGQNEVNPRNPGVGATGTLSASQHRMDNTVDRIDQHLLNAEKDRPKLPGQAPSPSQTLQGGTASPTGASSPR